MFHVGLEGEEETPPKEAVQCLSADGAVLAFLRRSTPKTMRPLLAKARHDRRNPAKNVVLQHGYKKRRGGHLEVSDVEGFFVDVGGVGAGGQTAHAGQIATVPPHGLNDKHTPLGAAGRLLDAVTSLTHTHTHTHTHCSQSDTPSIAANVCVRTISPLFSVCVFYVSDYRRKPCIVV